MKKCCQADCRALQPKKDAQDVKIDDSKTALSAKSKELIENTSEDKITEAEEEMDEEISKLEGTLNNLQDLKMKTAAEEVEKKLKEARKQKAAKNNSQTSKKVVKAIQGDHQRMLNDHEQKMRKLEANLKVAKEKQKMYATKQKEQKEAEEDRHMEGE